MSPITEPPGRRHQLRLQSGTKKLTAAFPTSSQPRLNANRFSKCAGTMLRTGTRLAAFDNSPPTARPSAPDLSARFGEGAPPSTTAQQELLLLYLRRRETQLRRRGDQHLTDRRLPPRRFLRDPDQQPGRYGRAGAARLRRTDFRPGDNPHSGRASRPRSLPRQHYSRVAL